MKRLVMAGGGHAHAVALLAWSRAKARPPLDVTLVSEHERQSYSGMLPGVIAGHYRREQAEIDLPGLAARLGARFVQARIAALEADQRRVVLDDGRAIEYDLASVDVGGVPDTSIPGSAQWAIPVKAEPVFTLAAQRIAVVGGGAAGVEMALAFRHLGRTVTLYSSEPPFHPRAAAALRRAGVNFIGLKVLAIERGPVVHAGRSMAEYDAVLLATAVAPAPWLFSSGLATDERGFVAVDRRLRSVSHPEVFAAGDCATLRDRPHAKAGVYAVRHGAVLAKNLLGGETVDYQPQDKYLVLLSCGRRYAIAFRGDWSAEGHWAWRWKDLIDRRFIGRFR